jgi:hypothetical protein
MTVIRVKPMKASCLRVLEMENEIREAAGRIGIELRIAVPVGAKRGIQRETLHVMFNRRLTRERILDWWPGSGLWRSRLGRDYERDPHKIIEVLRVALSEDELLNT